MSRPTATSLTGKGSFLVPLIDLLSEFAANVILAVWALGGFYARLFGKTPEEGDAQEEVEDVPERTVPSGAICDENRDDTCTHIDGAETQVQACALWDACFYNEDSGATVFSSPPVGQMLPRGTVPTPKAPLAAQPLARTVPAPSTSDPPSPSITKIVPRNLDSVLLAAASAHHGDKMICGALESDRAKVSAYEAPNGPNPDHDVYDAEGISPDLDVVQDSLVELQKDISPSPVSTPLQPSFSAALVAESEYFLHTKKPLVAQLDTAAPTMPRMVPARAGDGDISALLLTPLPLTQMMTDRNPVGEERPNAGYANDLADAAPSMVGPPRAMDEEHHGTVDAEEQLQHYEPEIMSAAMRFRSFTVPAVELLATPALPGPDDMVAEGMRDNGTQGKSHQERDRLDGEKDDGRGHEEGLAELTMTDNTTSAQAPEEAKVLEHQKPSLSHVSTHQSLGKSRPGALVNTARTPSKDGRLAPSPKEQQTAHKPCDVSLGKGSTSAAAAAAASTPRIVASSSKVKRSAVSPKGVVGVTATPATARRPVGPDPADVRSPLSANREKRPVVRKLNTTSPKAEGSRNTGSPVTARGNGSIKSPRMQTAPVLRSESSSARGGLPRYAAPTAASMARKTPSAGTTTALDGFHLSQRLMNTQKPSLATMGRSVGVEGVGADGGGTARSTTTIADAAKIRAAVSSSALEI